MKITKRLLAPTLLTLVVDDQMMMLFAAVHLSAFGPKPTAHVRFQGQSRHGALRRSAFSVAIGGKADMACCGAYVCF